MGEAIRTLPGGVAVEKVVQIRRRPFRGHVYDLQSANGLIIAAGVVCSNCRCSTIEIFERRKIVHPPAAVEVDGKMVQPDTAAAFRFNPGDAFKVVLSA
jgi:hypothetical protein